MDRTRSAQTAVVALGLVVLSVVLVRTAWVADDAFTTLRVVDNLWHGHGLRWNAADRVQVYTHPLWLLVLIPFGGLFDLHLTAMALTGGLSLALAAWIGLREARGPVAAAVGLAGMLGAMGFVDFATSGLENALAHALLAALAWTTARALEQDSASGRLTVAVVAGLVVLNRLDHAVLVGLPVALVLGRAPWSWSVRAAVAGALPLALWEGFSLVYYGALVPNTAYAKLGHGVGRGNLAVQGLGYLWNAVRWDPVTVAVGVLGVGVAVWRGSLADRALAGSVLGWLGYLLFCGGDHMAGRFLTPAFVLALILLVRHADQRVLGLVPGLIGLGLLAQTPPLTSPTDLNAFTVDRFDIADERALQYAVSGLLPTVRGGPPSRRKTARQGALARRKGPHTVERFMVGWYGYYAGPDVHLVDPVAVADPLLARLPARVGPHRVGHWFRDVPVGYPAVAASGRPLGDPRLDGLWADLHTATRGPLFTRERWAAIVRLNSGAWQAAIADWCAAECSLFRREELADLAVPRVLPEHGIGLRLPPRPAAVAVAVEAAPGTYGLRLYRRGELVEEQELVVGPGGRVKRRLGWRAADRLKLVPRGASGPVRRIRVRVSGE